jgi:hypothetical protein
MMDRQDNRLELELYLQGALDSEQEYEIGHEDVVIDMPQAGERVHGRDNLTHENEVRKQWATCGSSSWCKRARTGTRSATVIHRRRERLSCGDLSLFCKIRTYVGTKSGL